MSQILLQSTIKYLCENFTVLANNRRSPVEVAVTGQIGDTVLRVEPTEEHIKSNHVMWFNEKPVFITDFAQKESDTIKVEPLSHTVQEGSISYPNSNVTVNDWSVLDNTREEAPYLIIENAFRATSRREGYIQVSWTIGIQPHIAWSYQDIALVKVAEITDEIISMLESKMLYPKLPVLKLSSFIIEEGPFMREHPNVPEDVPFEPIYAGQRVILVFEDYLSSYENIDLDDFFEQF